MTALLFVASAHAVSGEAGAAGTFLNFGVGGRPSGMGKAFTGVSDDVDAIYWNPGGLAMFRSGQVTLQQTELVEDVSFQYLAVAQPIYTYGCIAAGALNLSAGTVDRTDANFVTIGSYENRETAYLASYAHRLGDHWGVGGTFKLVENVIDSKKASGQGGDVGVMYTGVNERFKVGAMVRNAWAPRYKFDTDTEDFSQLGRLGASYKLFGDRLLVAADLEKVVGGPERNDKWFGGVESKVFENISVRAGINTDSLTAGAGFGWKSFVIDYAAEHQELGFFHRLSLKVFFGGFEVDVSANPTVFSPVGLKRHTDITILCRNRHRIVKWLLTVKNAKGNIVKSFQGYDAPPQKLEWNGTNIHGRAVEPGTYFYQLLATDNRNKTEKSRVRQLKIVSPTPIELEAR